MAQIYLVASNVHRVSHIWFCKIMYVTILTCKIDFVEDSKTYRQIQCKFKCKFIFRSELFLRAELHSKLHSYLSLKNDSNQANRSVDEDESFIKPEVPGIPESPVESEDKVSEYIMNLEGKKG